ncbi:hypothetical protein SRIMM317S_02149 [Streptomyces rimosus subsp. rimosus]
MDHDHHVAAWQRLGAAVFTDGFTLTTACRACADDLDADFAGTTLITAGELRLLAGATDERARLVEDAQLVTGEGPVPQRPHPPRTRRHHRPAARTHPMARLRPHRLRQGAAASWPCP